ncbi:NAD(P)-binding protein [Gryllotalpicola koreensis]|uniref:FAD-binding protein n=1 Tax=Gryllotalpicola koreensis TaxID=993086 RepID=A0ABP7ZW61_9MICO
MTQRPAHLESAPAQSVDFLVIGAGPTGLGAAARLERRGAEYLLVDASAQVGGAAAAETDARGFSWSVAGASGAQWQAIAERLVDPNRLWLGTRIAHVDVARRTAILADGRAVEYRWCVSSAPLPTALSWAGARDLGVGLHAHRVLAVGVGFRGRVPAGLASALDAEHAPWSRLIDSSQLAPAGHWSVLAELRIPGRDDIDTVRVVDSVVKALAAYGAAPTTPATIWTREFAPARPEPSEDRDELLRAIDERLRANGFFSRGLLGGWRPEASDLGGAYRQGGEAVEAALAGAAEEAYWSGGARPVAAEAETAA